MNTFAFLLLCTQACLIQNVYSQCLGGAALNPALGGFGRSAYAYEAGFAGPAAAAYPVAAGLAGAYGGPAGLAGAYGGEGVGDVAVVGEMGVAGTTLVAGQVPILGSVRFGGDLPAAGAVTIAGSCGCGRGAYVY